MAKKGENIYKRHDGRWEGRVPEARLSNGKIKYHSLYGKSYGEVKLKLKDYVVKPKRTKTDITVSDWVNNYVISLKNKVKISTYNVYERYINNHIYPFFEKIRLRDLSKGILQSFVNAHSDLAPSTIKGIFSTVKEALKLAYDEGYIDAVWLGVALPKKKGRPVEVFSKEEQHMIECTLNFQENPNDIGILICLYTGLRIGEVCGLQWSDVDFQSNKIYVNRTIQRMSIDGKSKLVELPPKSENSRRNMPIPVFLAEELSKIKSMSTNSYVLNLNSHVMDPRCYQNQYKRILEKCGVKYRNFHCLRHTFSVRALELGFDVKTLSEVLGHSDATITLQRYAHSLDEHKRNSMEKLATLREL